MSNKETPLTQEEIDAARARHDIALREARAHPHDLDKQQELEAARRESSALFRGVVNQKMGGIIAQIDSEDA